MPDAIERAADYSEKIGKDTRDSYADVAARGQSKVSACGTLQRIAKAFLKFDKWADKTERSDLQRFASMPLTAENCSWPTECAFRESFGRVIVSSAENDRRSDGESHDHQEARSAFLAAVAQGASADKVKRVTTALDKIAEIEAENKKDDAK